MPVSNPLVLVADDEPSTLTLVAAHVRGKGFEVIEAADGDEAWDKAREYLPDLIILDVMMPGMSGWEVCRKVRESVSLAHTAVVMLTGIGQGLNELTSPLYGADAYVDKPFEFTDLDARIDEALINHRADGTRNPEPQSPAPKGKAVGTVRKVAAPSATRKNSTRTPKASKKALPGPAKKTAAKKAPKKTAAKTRASAPKKTAKKTRAAAPKTQKKAAAKKATKKPAKGKKRR
jgi:DNA-binding response OmpR family regulator